MNTTQLLQKAKEATLDQDILENARKTRKDGIGNWAEFNASTQVDRWMEAAGQPRPDEDQPEMWEKLEKAVKTIINETVDDIKRQLDEVKKQIGDTEQPASRNQFRDFDDIKRQLDEVLKSASNPPKES